MNEVRTFVATRVVPLAALVLLRRRLLVLLLILLLLILPLVPLVTSDAEALELLGDLFEERHALMERSAGCPGETGLYERKRREDARTRKN